MHRLSSHSNKRESTSRSFFFTYLNLCLINFLLQDQYLKLNYLVLPFSGLSTPLLYLNLSWRGGIPIDGVFRGKTSSDSSVRLSVFLIQAKPYQVIFSLGQTLNCDWVNWNWRLLTSWTGTGKRREVCFTVCHAGTSGRIGWVGALGSHIKQQARTSHPYFLAWGVQHCPLFTLLNVKFG